MTPETKQLVRIEQKARLWHNLVGFSILIFSHHRHRDFNINAPMDNPTRDKAKYESRNHRHDVKYDVKHGQNPIATNSHQQISSINTTIKMCKSMSRRDMPQL